MNPSSEDIQRMVVATSGAASVGNGRAHDLARKVIEGRVDPPNEASATLLEEFRATAEASEATRVARHHATSAASSATWQAFVDARAALSATPPGFRDLIIRDEETKGLIKLRIPTSMVAEG